MEHKHVQSECDFRKYDAVFIMLLPEYGEVEGFVVVQMLDHAPVIPHWKRGVVLMYLLERYGKRTTPPKELKHPRQRASHTLSKVPEPA